jgi:hypothetical protein
MVAFDAHAALPHAIAHIIALVQRDFVVGYFDLMPCMGHWRLAQFSCVTSV